MFFVTFLATFTPEQNRVLTLSTVALLLLLGVLYVLLRAFLIIENLRTLCFLPPSAYITTWAANVPHIT